MQTSEVTLDRPCANQGAQRHTGEFVVGRLVHEDDRQDRGAAGLVNIRDRGLDRVTRRDDVVDNQDFLALRGGVVRGKGPAFAVPLLAGPVDDELFPQLFADQCGERNPVDRDADNRIRIHLPFLELLEGDVGHRRGHEPDAVAVHPNGPPTDLHVFRCLSALDPARQEPSDGLGGQVQLVRDLLLGEALLLVLHGPLRDRVHVFHAFSNSAAHDARRRYQDVDDGKAGRKGERRRSDSAVPQSAVLGPTTERDSHDHYGDADDREYNGSDDIRGRQSDGRKSGAVEHEAETEDENDEPNYENHAWGGEMGIRFRLGFDCSHAETSIPPFLQSSSGGESRFWHRTSAVCRSVKLVGPPNVGTNRTKSAVGTTTLRSSAANASPSTMATRIYNAAFFSRPSSWTLCSKLSRMSFIGSEPEYRIVSWKSLSEYAFPSRFFTSLRSSMMRYLPIRYDSWYAGLYVYRFTSATAPGRSMPASRTRRSTASSNVILPVCKSTSIRIRQARQIWSRSWTSFVFGSALKPAAFIMY